MIPGSDWGLAIDVKYSVKRKSTLVVLISEGNSPQFVAPAEHAHACKNDEEVPNLCPSFVQPRWPEALGRPSRMQAK